MISKISESDRARIIELLKSDRYVHAVKAQREASGMTLKEAKASVDQLNDELGLPCKRVSNAGEDSDLLGPVALIAIALLVILVVALIVR